MQGMHVHQSRMYASQLLHTTTDCLTVVRDGLLHRLLCTDLHIDVTTDIDVLQQYTCASRSAKTCPEICMDICTRTCMNIKRHLGLAYEADRNTTRFDVCATSLSCTHARIHIYGPAHTVRSACGHTHAYARGLDGPMHMFALCPGEFVRTYVQMHAHICAFVRK